MGGEVVVGGSRGGKDEGKERHFRQKNEKNKILEMNI